MGHLLNAIKKGWGQRRYGCGKIKSLDRCNTIDHGVLERNYGGVFMEAVKVHVQFILCP
jgi:hypothetical protein